MYIQRDPPVGKFFFAQKQRCQVTATEKVRVATPGHLKLYHERAISGLSKIQTVFVGTLSVADV